jgi:DNA-directed RNA polymerase subunit L
MTDNPLASKRRLFIRMKKGSPDDALKKAVKYLDDEIKKFGKNFETSKSKK